MTGDSDFSPELRRALDGFAPPPLPADFAARTAALAASRERAPLPRLRRRSTVRRLGWVASGVAALSLVSAAAAATGVFGALVEVPVLSPIARKLALVAEPPAPQPAPVPVAAEALPVSGTDVARRKLDALLDDPAFRSQPPLKRRAEVRRVARELVASGEARPREVIAALRDTGHERVAALSPEQREELARTLEERREVRVERREERRETIAQMPTEQRREVREQIGDRLRDLRARRQEVLAPPPPEPAPAEEN